MGLLYMYVNFSYMYEASVSNFNYVLLDFSLWNFVKFV